MLYRNIYPQIVSPSQNKARRNSQLLPSVKFPEDLQVILRSDRSDYGNLFIGNVQAAQNVQLLQSLKINGILSMAEGHQIKHPADIIRHQCYIPISDRQDAEIYQEIVKAVQFLQNSLVVTNVLVHCVSGGWRSACAAVAYLIKSRKLSAEDAENQVKNRRKIVELNESAKYQLKKYELDLNNTGLRKSKFNYSMRVDTNKSANPHNQSYFRSQISQSESSLKTGANNPKIQSSRVKSQQKSNHSNLFKQLDKPQIVVSQPKVYTNAENPEHSFRENNKKCKSMAGLSNKSVKDKSYILEKSFRISSEEPSLRSLHFEPIEIQPLNSEGSQLPELNLTKKKSISRQQFDKKLKLLVDRNELINNRLFSIQQTFEKTHEANKLLLQCELKEIKMIEESIVRQYQDRKSKLKQKAKTIKDSQISSQNVQVPFSIHRESNLHDKSISQCSNLS